MTKYMLNKCLMAEGALYYHPQYHISKMYLLWLLVWEENHQLEQL